MTVELTPDQIFREAIPSRRWLSVTILLVVLTIAITALLISRLPPGLSRGVWKAEGESNRIVLSFGYTGALIAGTMHELHDDKQVLQWNFAGTYKGKREIELNWGIDNRMNLSVDLRSGELRGRLWRADGEELDLVFHRTEAAAVPGLTALTELPYQYRLPAAGSGWEIAEPSKVGIDRRRLEATYSAIAKGEAGLVHSQLIVRRGKLVAEEYFHGYIREDLHEMQSATKSVASLLIGIALDKGLIESLDEPVLTFFPEYAGAASPGWQKVTLRHLLTMTAGVDWDRREVNRGHPTGPELFRKVFSRQVVNEPGTRWLYNGADVNLLAGVIYQATGLHADGFAARHLFEPLGIAAWDWQEGKSEGFPSMAGTLHLRPLDMAKIGQLVLAQGRWQGDQVVSREWIAESTAPRIETPRAVQKYGYLWWRLYAPLDAGPHPVTIASGWGSQFIHIVPAFDAVLVTTGGNHANGETFSIDRVLLDNLVPGIER